MTAYWVAHVNVHDEAAYGEYARRAGPILEQFGGRILARGGRTVTLEGRRFERNVIVEFPDIETAEACYNSPEYQAACALQKGAAERDIAIIEGV